MANLDPEGNRLYEKATDLHPFHWETLGGRDPDTAARAAGAAWDGTSFSLPFLGAAVRVDPRARTVTFEEAPEHEPGYQRALVAVAYLAGAQEVPVKGEWVALRELPGGDAFFRGPHGPATPRLERAFGRRPEGLAAAAARLGGRRADAGDGAADVDALPRIPLRFVVWAGTDEFPPAATVLTDGRAHLHLPLDVLWALTNVAIADLTRDAALPVRARRSLEGAAGGSGTIPPQTVRCTTPSPTALGDEKPQGSCGPGGDPSSGPRGRRGTP